MPIKKEKVSFTYNLGSLLENVPDEDREDAAFDAGNAALDAVKEYMEGSSSPVKGSGRFKALSKDYKKKKQKIAGNTNPNLKLFGDLDEAMEVDADENSFTINIRDDNAAKAYNHNVGDTLPKRQFLPDDQRGETFKRSVVTKIKEQIAKYKKKPKRRPAPGEQPVEVGVSLEQIFKELAATKREEDIAKNITKITFKDIL
tara:strand:+ start:4863 stop:5465 length:603 start_codon:yes stop_codon:yes gene_type:complete